MKAVLSSAQFAEAARQRWLRFRDELAADVLAYNRRQNGAEFTYASPHQFIVSNATSGMALAVTADFDGRVVHYSYSSVNDHNVGVPEGGILSIRQMRNGNVDFYSADQRLTSEQTCKVLLEPVLSPPQIAA